MPSRKISAAERLTGHSFISFTQDILKADSCMVKLSDDEIELKTWIPDTLRGRGKIKKPIWTNMPLTSTCGLDLLKQFNETSSTYVVYRKV